MPKALTEGFRDDVGIAPYKKCKNVWEFAVQKVSLHLPGNRL